jgi:uncharacterized membrane protein (UPF0136 family)
MATENIQIDVNSQELQALIAQLNEAQAQLAAMEQAADEAANSMDKLGDEAAQAGRQVDAAGKEGADGMEGMGLAAGAAAVAIAGVAAAAALAGAAIAKYTEKTVEQKTQLNSLLNQTDLFLESLGRTIVESDGVSRAMGQLSRVMVLLENNADTTEAAVSGLVNGALFVLEAAIQTGIASWGLYKLAVIGAEGAIDTIYTNMVQFGDTVRTTTIAVADLGLAFAEGLVAIVGQAVEKVGQLVEVLRPFASRIGLDLSGVTSTINLMNDSLDGTVANLQAMRDAQASSAAGIYEQQQIRLEELERRRVERGEEQIAIIEQTGESMMIVAGSFNSANTALSENVRLTEEAATATEALVESYQILGGLIGGFAISTAMSMTTQAAVTSLTDFNSYLEEQATQTAERMAREEAARAADLDAYRTDLETRFELLNGFSIAYEELSEKQRVRLSKMSDAQAEAAGLAVSATKDVVGAGVSSLTAALANGENVGKAFKKMLGEQLVSMGTAAVLQGAIEVIPGPTFNPFGFAKIAAGGIAIGAGTQMGAAGGASPSVASPRASGSNQTTYSNVSFGFAGGDRRAIARDVADANRDAQRRGA